MEYKVLSNGIKVPILGYGTFRIPKEDTYKCIREALDIGYRMFDTASAYFNEEEIGQAIKDSNIDRKDIFISTKVWIQDAGYQNTLKAFEKSLQNLQTDYIDLYMIHQPFSDYYGSYKAMEELYEKGSIKALGICNFYLDRFIDLYLNTTIKPHVNQIECHPFFIRKEEREILDKFGCAMEAWGPLNEGQRDIFENEVLKQIAMKHHKTVSQIILRWHIENDTIVIPRTIYKERMIENMNIFDFKLDEEDKQKIESLDIGHSEIIDHTCISTVKALNKLKIHE